MLSRVRDRVRAYLARDVPSPPMSRLRVAFALIWFAYDALDLAYGGTAASANWLAGTLHPRPVLVALQLALLAAEASLVLGRAVFVAGTLAAALRLAEARWVLSLNDFYYYAVTALLLAQTGLRAAPDDPRRTTVPAWTADALRWQTAWIYFATALLKLNPVWLSGGHLFVRHEYLAHALDWPYPALFQRCAESLACNAMLARAGVLAELTLAAVLFVGRPRVVALALAVGIHAFGALGTNVWFFGASMVAQVALVMPRARPTVP